MGLFDEYDEVIPYVIPFTLTGGTNQGIEIRPADFIGSGYDADYLALEISADKDCNISADGVLQFVGARANAITEAELAANPSIRRNSFTAQVGLPEMAELSGASGGVFKHMFKKRANPAADRILIAAQSAGDLPVNGVVILVVGLLRNSQRA